MIVRSIVLTLFGGLLLLLAVRRLRQFRLRERHALTFMLIGLPVICLAIWPGLIEVAAEWSGIEQKTVLIMAVSIVLLLMVFELLTIVSVQERRISVLAQHVGILMQKLEESEAEKATSADDKATSPSDGSITGTA